MNAAQDLGARDGAAAMRCSNQLGLAMCANTLLVIRWDLSALRLHLAVTAPTLAPAVAVAVVITRRTARPHGDRQDKVHERSARDAVAVCCSQSTRLVCH